MQNIIRRGNIAGKIAVPDCIFEKSGQDVLGIFNLGFDPLDTVLIRCAKKPVKAEILQVNGRWKVLPFDWDKGVMELPVRLECYEPAVFRVATSE